MKKAGFYYLTAFISGMAVMAVEMSASRLLAPYFGSSLHVWTNVIGLVMLALSLGYFFGGRIADKHPKQELYFFFVIVTGFWVMLIPFVSPFLFDLTLNKFSDLSSMVVWGSFISIFILIVIPMIFLGAIVPFSVKLLTKDLKKVGSYSGQVSLASTGGSLLGTFLPAFLLIPLFGVTKTFVLMGVILVLTGGFGLNKLLFKVLGFSFFLFWLVPPVLASDEIIYLEESSYGTIYVSEYSNGARALQIGFKLGVQSIYDPNELLTPLYYSYFSVVPSMIDDTKNVLILGHAGGSFTRIFNYYYPELVVLGVEIDPAVTRISKEFMGMDDANVEIIHGDARSYLYSTDEKYDLILVDTYNSVNIPSHMATGDFFQLASSHLNEGGLLGLNMVATEGKFRDVLLNSIAANFGSAISLNIPNTFNTMVLAGSDDENFEMVDVPNGLGFYENFVLENSKVLSYDEKLGVFEDEYSSKVDVLIEEMLQDLFEYY